jgi:2-desacetyl-2-hydroxyethyl bacteriochlorophyllide A dehydrogenase
MVWAQDDDGDARQPSRGGRVSDPAPNDPAPNDWALWTTAPGRVELQPAHPGPPAPGQVLARALVSGISRGTERLVLDGRVPPSERSRMRCPFQEGDFPYPVKYGYAMVALVEAGPAALVGRRVFALHPHQSRFLLPAEAAVPVPAAVPTERAALAPQMETALNANWDAGVKRGERVAVVGGGVIGLLTAWLAARGGRAEVTLVDADPARRSVAERLGLAFALPADAPADCATVFHASGTAEGLNLALSLCAFEGQVIELSWYGDRPAAVDLGGAFHSRRLTIRASQVGTVAPSRRKAWSRRRRLERALSLCRDERLDVLVRDETPLAEMPARMAEILADPGTLCHLIRY